MPTSKPVCLFQHIPKTGGSTLASCLYAACAAWEGPRAATSDGGGTGEEAVLEQFYRDGVFFYPIGFFKDPPDHVPAYLPVACERSGLAAVTGHFAFGIHRFISRSVSYVTLVRDPVERVLSLYHHLAGLQILKPSVSLTDFVRGPEPEAWNADLVKWHPSPPPHGEEALRHWSRTLVDNDQTRRLAGREPEFGQCDADLLAAAQDNLSRHFRLAGVTERFDEALVLLKMALSWEHVPAYVPKLVNHSRPRAASVPRSVRDLIAERNQLDMQLHAFVGELFEQRVRDAGGTFQREYEAFTAANRQHIAEQQRQLAAQSLFAPPGREAPRH